MKKKSKELEKYIHEVYTMLLNMKDENIAVELNERLSGRSGTKHEIDVFYKFFRAGVEHCVAIECKATNRRIEKGDIIEFSGKIADIGNNICGIVVSTNGFQKGAYDYAKFNNIKLMTLNELPAMNTLLADRLKAVGLPEEDYIGEPFWTIMEYKNGNVTGNYNGQIDPKGIRRFTLFFSKRVAERYWLEMPNKERWCVRGLPQHCLRAVLLTALFMNADFSIIMGKNKTLNRWEAGGFSFDHIKDEYYLGPKTDFDSVRRK